VRPGVRIAIDVGSVRVGVAASDPDGNVALPVMTLRRDQRGSRDIEQIAGIVRERSAVTVVVGLPRTLRDTEGVAARDARAYAAALATSIAPVPVSLVDERLSTAEADKALRGAGIAGRARRTVVDQMAAVAILQRVLDAERAGSSIGERVQ